MKRHVQANHNNIGYPCKFCECIAKSKEILKRHMQSKHSETTLFCSKCDYKTTAKRNMKHHLQTKHKNLVFSDNGGPSDKDNIFACQYCLEKFTWIALLQRIKVVHQSITDPTVIESLLEI